MNISQLAPAGMLSSQGARIEKGKRYLINKEDVCEENLIISLPLYNGSAKFLVEYNASG